MSLRFKTVMGVALIEALLLALLIATVIDYQHNSAERALLKRAQTTAALFASTTKDPVLSLDLASLEAFGNELMQNPDLVFVRVLDQNGFEYSAQGDEGVLSRAFVEDRALADVDDGVFDVSASITEGDISYGRVELGFDIDSIREVIAETRELSIGIAIVEMVLVGLFSFILGTYLTGQLKVLRESAKKISKGDYNNHIEVKSRDEIPEVADAFNSMSRALKDTQTSRDKYEKELEQLNQELELRVERRTAQIKKQIEALEEANKKLARTQAKLIQSETLASVGQMAAGVAHEINNPIGFVRSNLSSLSGYVSTYQQLLKHYSSLKGTICVGLQNSGRLPESELMRIIDSIEKLERSEDIEFIGEDVDSLLSESIDGTTRVRDIVTALKNFYPDENFSDRPCLINDCINRALSGFSEKLGDPVVIKKDLQAIPAIAGDAEKLTHVLLEILDNANDATGQNCEISVTSKYLNNRVVVTISDNGEGIDKKNIDRIFDPFFTTKQVGEGTGLGLAVCYGTLKSHNGSIEVDSTIGEGSTFTLTFPVTQMTAVAA